MTPMTPFVHSLAHIDVCVAAIRSCATPIPDAVSGVDVRTLTPTTLGRMLAEVNLGSMLRARGAQVGAQEYLAYAEALETYVFTIPATETDPARRIANRIAALRGLYQQSTGVPGLAGVRVAGIISAAMHQLGLELMALFADPVYAALTDEHDRARIPAIEAITDRP